MSCGGLNRPVAMGLRTAAVAVAVLGLVLLSGAVELVDLITPGEDGPSATIIAEDFGRDAVPPDRTGYDGQQFYAIARFFPDLELAAEHLDAPRYRLLRIAAPAIASAGGEGPPVVLLLVGLNILGVGLAVGGLASLCEDRRWRAEYGYAAALPLLFGIVGTTADPLAAGLSLAGLAASTRGRHWVAVALLVLAALTREQMAAVALAAALGSFMAGERRAVLAGYAAPALATIAWYLALGEIVGGEVPERFEVLGLLDAGASGALLGLGVMAICLLGAWRWRTLPVAWPVALGFGLWILLYFPSAFVIEGLSRASAPALALGLAALGHDVLPRLNASRPPS